MPPPVLSVSELNRLVRTAIEQRLPLLWVSGEVSNLTRAPSGHIYFSLKDAAAQVRCVMFRSRAQLLPWRLENGQQVEANALPSLYEARGEFQLGVETLRRAGIGKLYEAFVRLRDKLAAEGLFADDLKRPLPRFPPAVGIVTSPRAAALHDVLTALERRAPHVPVVIYPTLVQGDDAPAQIVAALAAASARAECDLLLLVRGGGSLEDLVAFNDEAVARAVRDCPLPVVVGVGHETDTTIADLAADRRAPTPTAAAEFASAGWHAAAEEVAALDLALTNAMRRRLERRMQAVDLLARRLVHPAEACARTAQRLAHLATRLEAAAHRRLHREHARLAELRLRSASCRPHVEAKAAQVTATARRLEQAWSHAQEARRARLERLAASLAALNPDATLARGYSIVRDAAGAIVRDAVQVTEGDRLSLRFGTGSAETVVIRAVPD